jgi:ribosomal protein S18 acetylase RimI-like enzyme
MPVAQGVTVHDSSFEASIPFIRAHYARIFCDDASSPFAVARVSDAKARYYRVAGDFFEFKSGDETVALLVGTPVDWSTYYIRSAAALPEFQGKKVVQRFLPFLFELLREAGVERVEADTSPSNMATLHLLTRLRFNPTGTILSDRFGALVHFTRFLDRDSEDVFVKSLCTGIPYQLRERTRRAAPSEGRKGNDHEEVCIDVGLSDEQATAAVQFIAPRSSCSETDGAQPFGVRDPGEDK